MVEGEPTPNSAPSAPSRFHNAPDGLYALATPGETDGARLRISDPLHVDALVRSVEKMEWGKRARWRDPDGNDHEQVIALAALQGDGLELCRMLANGGLMIEPGFRARNLMLEYLACEMPAKRVTVVSHTGWHKAGGSMVYVTPSMTIGLDAGAHEVVLSAERVAGSQSSAGTAELWKKRLAGYCSGNSRLLLSVSMAFAAVLLPFSALESGGLHLIAISSVGKTTAARAAASVCGGPDYMQRWRATINGLEAIAALHSCALLILDEMGQVDPREVGESSYMLANGQGKQRATKTGGAARRQKWHLLFLSTGEVGLSQHMAAAGKSTRAGQEVRLAELQADAGQGHGIFENLHGFPDGAALSDAIKVACSETYGTAGIEFIRRCVVEQHKLKELVASRIQAFVSGCEQAFGDDGKLGGQAHRVCERFGLTATAGELATSWEITGWQPGEAQAAVMRCFGEWLSARGTAGNTEPKAIIDTLREFISRHEDARFVDIDAREIEIGIPSSRKTPYNRAGWRKRFDGDEREFLIDPEVFRKDIFAGFDLSLVCQVLSAAGFLVSGEEGGTTRYTLQRHLGIHGRRRVYVITNALWDDHTDPST